MQGKYESRKPGQASMPSPALAAAASAASRAYARAIRDILCVCLYRYIHARVKHYCHPRVYAY